MKPFAIAMCCVALVVAPSAESQSLFGLTETRLRTAPDPFSLDGYSAVQAVWMLRRARFLQRLPAGEPTTAPETVVIESVRVVRAADADRAGERRYDLELNGRPLAWDELYILYDGRMTNLRLLFTYRNQRPVPGARYLIPETTGSGGTR